MTRTAWLLPSVAIMLAITGCKKEEDNSSAPEAEPSTKPAAVPEEADETPTTSIIRPDITPEPMIDIPPPSLETTIGFPAGGNDLDDNALAELNRVLKSDQLARGWPVILWGHTDSTGRDEANLRVSEKRAQVVADYLIDHGVDEKRISVIPMGEQRQAEPNAKLDGTPDEAGRAANRRVELKVEAPDQDEGDTGSEAKVPDKNAEENTDSDSGA
ncbi:OmpA family protein [Altericroceibacterium spongiae]|uniref:OmpA family protein n=1 Tax=Altericroceibacterium spongiae TaxID=2320269 RepID=A0A420EIP8_9SPHN|nr:OmpA family protein [Altericroceibacterium spongiae]RKF20534.1 OmpA family protein [Altericroceibacterium spongiae]